MRTSNSTKNAIVSVISNILNIIIGIVAQAIFLKTLGSEYLGLNGLFTNIISILAITELGIGSAIVYHLYKPIAEDNKEQIKSLMHVYKNCYRIISLVVLIIGLILIPFLPFFIGKNNISDNINLIFILFLLDSSLSYLLTYKRSILYADQKNYIINIVHIIYIFTVNLLQIIILILYKNYIAYLIIKVVLRFAENLVIVLIVNKKYPYLNHKNVKKIDNSTKNDIIKKIKALIMHKISSFIVMGTDSIIISKFLGLVTVGLYSNYRMVINSVSTLFSQIFTSITASVGNLLVEKNKEKNYIVYKKNLFINFWFFAFATICIFFLIEPFIAIFFGKEYILDKFVLVCIVINFYINGMRCSISPFKDAAGICYEDRFVPIIESLINLVVSLVLAKFIGLAGVIIGTICSNGILFLYSYPTFVYKPLFGKSRINFVIEQSKYFIVLVVTLLLQYVITFNINISSPMLSLLFNGIICVILPNLVFFILFRKSEEFDFMKNTVISVIKKRKRK